MNFCINPTTTIIHRLLSLFIIFRLLHLGIINHLHKMKALRSFYINLVLQFAAYRLCRYWFNNGNVRKALHVRKVRPDVPCITFKINPRIKLEIRNRGLQEIGKDVETIWLTCMILGIVDLIMQI